MAKEIDLVKIDDLHPGINHINLIAKLVEIGKIRTELSTRGFKRTMVADALIGDETGSILVTLRGTQASSFTKGDVIQIQNGYTSMIRGSLQLKIGRQSKLQKVDLKLGKVNTENTLSKKVWT
jgi:replication factor A1